MNDMERDIGLVLLKRLRQRNLISEEMYVSASHSRFFDRKRFVQCGEGERERNLEGGAAGR